jgi:ribosome-associated toxin RatA of RatAB toxin-antitoxin module
MNVIDRSALVPYPAASMYALVNDVAAYPSFLDGCVGAEVLSVDAQSMVARLDLAKGGMRYSFTTRNALMPPSRIELTLVEGPFDHFRGEWQFTALNGSACKVTLHLEFSMAGRLGKLALRALFNGVANHLVDALVKRAHKLQAAGALG